jgi:hypothetical protein
LLSPFLFLLAIDYIMRESTEGKRNGIQWTMWQQLDDLDFTDDIVLISSIQQQLDDLDFTDDIVLISSTQQQLDDLDFADDIAFISSIQQQMQERTSLLAETSIKLGL